MRRLFLWAARNGWLQEHLPRHAVHAPGGAPVHARRDDGFGAGRRRAAPGRRHRDDVHAARREPREPGRGGRGRRPLHRRARRDHGRVAWTARSRSSPPSSAWTIDEDRALAHLTRLAAHAATTGSYVWIDMEGSAYTDATLRLYERAPRRRAANGDLPAGVPPPDGRRHRAASPAGSGHPPRQGRLRRAGRPSPIATSARSTPATSSSPCAS